MSNDYYHNKDEAISFKQIALKQYQSILTISCSEFRGGFYTDTSTGNISSRVYVSDKRSEFNQAVEILALAMFPHFDKKMRESYETFLRLKKELFTKWQTENFVKGDSKQYHSIETLEITKDLFRELSCLMFRLDYFKTAAYSDEDLAQEITDVDERKMPIESVEAPEVDED